MVCALRYSHPALFIDANRILVYPPVSGACPAPNATRLVSDDAEEAADRLDLTGARRQERAGYGHSLLEFAQRKNNFTSLTRRIEKRQVAKKR